MQTEREAPHQAEVGDGLAQRQPRHRLGVDQPLERLLPDGRRGAGEAGVRLRKDGDVGDGQLQGPAALLLRDQAWRGGRGVCGGPWAWVGGCSFASMQTPMLACVYTAAVRDANKHGRQQ